MVDPVSKTTGSTASARLAPRAATPSLGQPDTTAARPTVKSTVTVAAMVDAGPPVDIDKVAALKADIAAGRYVINADRLAADILGHGDGSDKA